MQDQQKNSETLNISGGQVEQSSFDGNHAPVIKDNAGNVTINHFYSDSKKLSHNDDSNAYKDRIDDTTSHQDDSINSVKTANVRDELRYLLVEKKELEIKLQGIESKIRRIEYTLKGESNPSLTSLLHWLDERKHLSKKYGNIAFKRFRDLKKEASEKESLDDFYFQIENYLELIRISLQRDNKIFLREPRVPPTFSDIDIYEYASSDLYKEVFKILIENIPRDNVESSLRDKLEEHFDELLKSLQAHF